MTYEDFEKQCVTEEVCSLKKKLFEAKLETFDVRLNNLSDKVNSNMNILSERMDVIDTKLEKLIELQENTYKTLIWLSVGIILVLIGVVTGRALDFGWLVQSRNVACNTPTHTSDHQ